MSSMSRDNVLLIAALFQPEHRRPETRDVSDLHRIVEAG